MKILVTGGAGYIGSHICKELREKNYEPIVFDNLSEGYKKFVKWGEFVYGDLSKPSDLSKLDAHDIKATIHLANNAYVPESWKNPSKYYKNNISNGINLLEYLKKRKVLKFIFSSTCAVYKNSKKALNENSSIYPSSPYGRSKLFFEQILEDYSKVYNFKVCTLRYFNASGADKTLSIGEAHVPETHLIPNLIEAFEKKKTFYIYGKSYPTRDGTCIRDFIHVTDLAVAHCKALKKINKISKKFTIFNLGSGKSYSVLDVVNEVKKFSNKKVNLKFAPKRSGDVSVSKSNIKLAKFHLNWKPENSSLRNIIKTAYLWYKKKKKIKLY
tara:strand:- start:1417 stop:2397 length:981 start_codon:yes stop_codon:yes gene_type:complete